MRHLLSLFTAVMICSLSFAQNAKFISAMEKNKSILDTARTPATWQNVTNNLERIANVEKSEWLAQYYLAYAYTMKAYFFERDKDKKDEMYNKATEITQKADSISPNNSEIYTLKGLIQQMQLQINPMMRGQKYGPLAGMNFEKAITLDPNNPRPLLLKAQGLYYTPTMFGGGKDKAMPFLNQAIEKFSVFKPASSIHPTWGSDIAKKLLEDSKK